MYRNLNASALGVSGRQSELIELALTYGFRGLDLDIEDLIKRARSQGTEQARRFLISAHVKVGGFDLPVRWREDETTYQSDLASLNEICEIAASIEGRRCSTPILPASDDMPYHENFEFCRKRIAEIAEVLQKFDMRLGLELLAAPDLHQNRQFEFIHQAEAMLTLIKTIGATNVGLVFDTWDWHLGGGRLDQLRELKSEQIVMVRLADLPVDADLATISQQQRLLPGQGGTIDCVATLNLLAELGYDGPVSVYPDPGQFRGMTRDAIVAQAQSVLDEQWKAANLNKAGRAAPVVAES